MIIQPYLMNSALQQSLKVGFDIDQLVVGKFAIHRNVYEKVCKIKR